MSQPAVNLKQILAAIPTRNTAVREETRGEALVLFVPIRKRWWMTGPLSWCLPLRREKGVALDAIGQEVWQACDGQHCLETLVEDFADRHRLGFHEARLTVMRFLRMLAQRNLLVLVGPTEISCPKSARAGDGWHPPLTPPSREEDRTGHAGGSESKMGAA